MAKFIDKDALVAEIERRRNICKKVVLDLRTKENQDYYQGKAEAYKEVLDLLDTIEVKEVNNTPNIRFPHYKSIVEKVFGAGNLESFEYDEAEQLVSLAKEELLKDLEVKEVDLEDYIDDASVLDEKL